MLQAYAEGKVLDSFINTQGSQSNGSVNIDNDDKNNYPPNYQTSRNLEHFQSIE